jgi:hypothetical protein
MQTPDGVVPYHAQLPTPPEPAFLQANHLVIKRKLLKLIGATFHIFDGSTLVEVATANQKGLKLKEDIRVVVGGKEVLGIFARQIIDFSASYDIVDLSVAPNVRIGVLRRRGMKSAFVRDEWEVMDPYENLIGYFYEDSGFLGVLRRFVDFVSLFVPQNYDLTIGPAPEQGRKVGDFRQNRNPFTYHLNIYSLASPQEFDRRIILAAGILAAAIEGRQR